MNAHTPFSGFSTHAVRFARNRITGEFRGFCSCGWEMTGKAEDVQSRAATHDRDELCSCIRCGETVSESEMDSDGWCERCQSAAYLRQKF